MKLIAPLLASAMMLCAASASATDTVPSGLFDPAPAAEPQFICACFTQVNLATPISWSVEDSNIVGEVLPTAPVFWSGGAVFTWVQFPPAVGGWAVDPTVTPVPEPETYAMLGAGLLLVGAARRRAIKAGKR